MDEETKSEILRMHKITLTRIWGFITALYLGFIVGAVFNEMLGVLIIISAFMFVVLGFIHYKYFVLKGIEKEHSISNCKIWNVIKGWNRMNLYYPKKQF